MVAATITLILCMKILRLKELKKVFRVTKPIKDRVEIQMQVHLSPVILLTALQSCLLSIYK